jgi:hypothetical protein
MIINVYFENFYFSFLREHDDYKLFFLLDNLLLFSWNKNRNLRLEMLFSKNTICCENVSNLICCVLSRNVKCDREMRFQIFLLQRYFCEFVFVIMLDHLIVRFFWSSNFIFDEWRMLILDYRVTYVCSQSVERRLWWDVRLDEAFHQTWRKRLIKLDESDSSNLTKETSSFQTWRKRHFIKLEIVISSNFWKERQFFYFLMSDLMQRRVIWWCEKLNLAENHFFVRK